MITPAHDLKPIPIKEAFKTNLGISAPTGYRLIADGTLRTLKIGSRRYTTLRFLNEAVEKLAGKAGGQAVR
jgi:predicted DNA-binding transcriptional regulator AlpA